MCYNRTTVVVLGGGKMRQQILPGEWRIIECLWEKMPQTLMDIVRAMQKQTSWAKSTITTMIFRMEKKGLIRFEIGQGKAKMIYPVISRAQAAVQETDALLQKVYHGNIVSMVSSLVDGRNIKAAEIAELYVLLDKAREDEKK